MRKITKFLGGAVFLSLFAFSDLSAQSECDGFQVLPAAICGADNQDFNVLLVFDGAESVTVTDNSTGGSITTVASSVTFGPIMSGTGYSFSVSPAGFSGCVLEVSQSIVDCNTTSVELIRFDGTPEVQGNLIVWETATQTDVKSFIVEHSTNGFDFEKIGTVQAAGNSNTAESYSLMHEGVKAGAHYYRLLEETNAGLTNIIANVIEIDRSATQIEIADISPVPAVDFVNVEFFAQANQNITIEVVDLTGRVLNSNVMNSVEGNNAVTMDVANLAVGTYFVTISDNSQTIIGKFVKN